ncbi:MAG: DnaD domain protein [Clostridia bacterium]|nr:DnaD domain protein [Clostridia bacterium]
MFKVNPKVYASMFSLPTEIVDKGLKFATGEQIKVILCIFRNPEITIEELMNKTNLSKNEAEECIEYWQDNGILETEVQKEQIKTEKQIAPVEKLVKPLPEIRYTSPTQDEINKILKGRSSIKRLFLEAQEILGVTIGYSMQCTIHAVVFCYGIKPDVANCLLHFAKSVDSVSQDDIIRIAKYWAENGITNQAAADDYINETDKALSVFRELAIRTNNDTSPPTFAVLELFCEWLRWGYSIEEIEKAFNIMKSEKLTGRLVWRNVTHMNGTIKNWRKAEMFTVEDIEKGTKKFESKASKSQKKQTETSFDIDKAEQKARENRKDFGTKKNKKRTRVKGA